METHTFFATKRNQLLSKTFFQFHTNGAVVNKKETKVRTLQMLIFGKYKERKNKNAYEILF